MNDFFMALAIGIVAGIVDVVPMIVRKLDKYACISAFLHWLALGLIIPFVGWGLQPWLKGVVISLLTAIPIMLIVYPQDSKALIPMSIFSVLLGAAVGIAGAAFIA